MRNTLQYPITHEERIQTLSELRDAITAEDACGDIRPLVLQQCIDLLETQHELQIVPK